MSDLTTLSPLNLVSAACFNPDLNKFDAYVYLTSLVFMGICALVWVVFYVRVSMLKPAQVASEQGGDNNDEQVAESAVAEQTTEEDEQGNESNNTPPPKTREQMYSEHMGLFLLITFLAYPNLSKIQFESLDCSTEFDGRKYLR